MLEGEEFFHFISTAGIRFLTKICSTQKITDWTGSLRRVTSLTAFLCLSVSACWFNALLFKPFSSIAPFSLSAYHCRPPSLIKKTQGGIFEEFYFRIPTRYWKYRKSIELWNRFARPWKSIEFVENVHEVLKKYGNSKFRSLPLLTVLQMFFWPCVPLIKVWKMFFKIVWEPCYLKKTIIPWSPDQCDGCAWGSSQSFEILGDISEVQS